MKCPLSPSPEGELALAAQVSKSNALDFIAVTYRCDNTLQLKRPFMSARSWVLPSISCIGLCRLKERGS